MSVTQEISPAEGAIIISCSDVPAEEIILQILATEAATQLVNKETSSQQFSPPQSFITDENIKGYPWFVETKYYTAEANLFAVEAKNLFSPSFADTIRATVFYFDSQKPSCFEDVLKWMPYLQDLSSEVQLLVCTNCSEEGNVTALQRQNILDWCLKHEFELVELEPIEDYDEDVEDIFQDTKGYARVVQALHSYPWVNLVMKEEPRIPSKRLLEKLHMEETMNSEVLPDVKQLNLSDKAENSGQDTESASSITEPESSDAELEGSDIESKSRTAKLESTNAKAESPKAKSESLDDKSKSSAAESERSLEDSTLSSSQAEELRCLMQDDQQLWDEIKRQDPTGDSFESVFTIFREMKEKASELSSDERKSYAEKIAIGFWRAVGGDEEEIAGLSD